MSARASGVKSLLLLPDGWVCPACAAGKDEFSAGVLNRSEGRILPHSWRKAYSIA
ncbi:MAG: hypothetical protein D9V47_02855 [Clostridia bacterium]|nr:MAG: hypothetical protein D9V47_02855 [Clostridia bacterium]